VTSDGLLLLSSEGEGALTCPCLVQGLACGNHSNDESLLLSAHNSDSSLSHDYDMSSFLLAAVVAAACYPSTMESLELLPDMVGKMVVVGGGEP
jgi:hypothetical protein